jgi:hypothetical protein
VRLLPGRQTVGELAVTLYLTEPRHGSDPGAGGGGGAVVVLSAFGGSRGAGAVVVLSVFGASEMADGAAAAGALGACPGSLVVLSAFGADVDRPSPLKRSIAALPPPDRALSSGGEREVSKPPVFDGALALSVEIFFGSGLSEPCPPRAVVPADRSCRSRRT